MWRKYQRSLPPDVVVIFASPLATTWVFLQPGEDFAATAVALAAVVDVSAFAEALSPLPEHETSTSAARQVRTMSRVRMDGSLPRRWARSTSARARDGA